MTPLSTLDINVTVINEQTPLVAPTWSRPCLILLVLLRRISAQQPGPSNMIPADLEPGTDVLIISNSSRGPEVSTTMASILELTDPRVGEGHHTPTHYVPTPETCYLVRHCRNGRTITESIAAAHLYMPRFCIGDEVFLDYNLDFEPDRAASFARKNGMDGPFRVVGIAYPDPDPETVTRRGVVEAEYEIQIGTGTGTGSGGGGFRRWWRESWLRGSREAEDEVAFAEQEQE
jgi:hypothetical protein